MKNAQYVVVITRFYDTPDQPHPEEAWYVAVANNIDQAKQMLTELHKNARPDSDFIPEDVTYTQCSYEPDGVMCKIDDMRYHLTLKRVGDAS